MKSEATSIQEYLLDLPDDRKEDIVFLDCFIQKTVPGLAPNYSYNMLGYGLFPYRNYKKELISWPVIALANQKNYISLYVCALDGSKYLAEKYKEKLGKVSVGKSCIRFKGVSDLNLETLKEVLILAEKSPGLQRV